MLSPLPHGDNIPGKFVLSSRMGKWAQDTCAVVGHRRARQSLGTGPCGDCRGAVGINVPFAPRGLFGKNSFHRATGIPGPRGQYSGQIHFIKKLGVQDKVGWLC